AHTEGDDAACRAALAAVVADAGPEGDLGIFRVAGRPALGPVRALYRVAPSAFLRAIVDQPVMSGPNRPAADLVEQLTGREYMVLALLPTRMSSAEMAGRMGISLNTVKTHLKHIYRKFGVAGRKEAVETAESLGLV